MHPRSIQFVKYTANTFVIKLFILALTAAIAIITARVLGPSGKGQLAILTTTVFIAVVVGELGLGQAIVYYLAGRRRSLKEIASSSLLCHAVIGIIITVLLIAIVGPLKETVYAGMPYSYILCVIALVPFILITSSQRVVMQGLYKIPVYNFLQILQPAIFLILLLPLIVVADWGLKGAIIAWGIACLITFLGAIFAVLKEKGIDLSRVNTGALKGLLSFGAKSWIGNLLKSFTYRIDIFIVAYFLPAAAVGYYAVAVTVAEVIWQIPDAVQTVLFPRIASFDKSDARKFTPIVCRQTVALTGVACCLLLATANVLVPFVFGQAYSPSILPLLILMPGVFMFAIWKVLHADLVAQGFPLKYSATAAVAMATMVALDLILIPRWGINGAALASTIAYTAATVLVIYWYLRITKNPLKGLLILESGDFARYKSLLKSLAASLTAGSGKE